MKNYLQMISASTVCFMLVISQRAMADAKTDLLVFQIHQQAHLLQNKSSDTSGVQNNANKTSAEKKLLSCAGVEVAPFSRLTSPTGKISTYCEDHLKEAVAQVKRESGAAYQETLSAIKIFEAALANLKLHTKIEQEARAKFGYVTDDMIRDFIEKEHRISKN